MLGLPCVKRRAVERVAVLQRVQLRSAARLLRAPTDAPAGLKMLLLPGVGVGAVA